jgi:hypothetical protein
MTQSKKRRHLVRATIATGMAGAAALALVSTAGASKTATHQHSSWATAVQTLRAAAAKAHPQTSARANARAFDAPNSATSSPTVTTVLTGLNNPRGVMVRPTGSVYVAEAGTGGSTCQSDPEFGTTCAGLTGSITKLRHGGAVSKFETGLLSFAGPDGSFATGVDDVAADGDYNLDFIATSAGPDGTGITKVDAQAGNLLRAQAHQTPHSIGDIDDVEFGQDPDGQGPDSDPYGVTEGPGGAYQLVADAAGNDLLKVQDGKVSVFAIFPNQTVETPDGLAIHQPVPTRVVLGPDGNFYVGMLGSEFDNGASVWKVTPQGLISEIATGFTAIQGLAFDKAGNMYVGELVKSWASTEEGDFTGALIKVAKNGTRTEIAAGQLDAIGGVAVAPDGSLYVSTNMLFPGAGELVHITGV